MKPDGHTSDLPAIRFITMFQVEVRCPQCRNYLMSIHPRLMCPECEAWWWAESFLSKGATHETARHSE